MGRRGNSFKSIKCIIFKREDGSKELYPLTKDGRNIRINDRAPRTIYNKKDKQKQSSNESFPAMPADHFCNQRIIINSYNVFNEIFHQQPVPQLNLDPQTNVEELHDESSNCNVEYDLFQNDNDILDTFQEDEQFFSEFNTDNDDFFNF